MLFRNSKVAAVRLLKLRLVMSTIEVRLDVVNCLVEFRFV